MSGQVPRRFVATKGFVRQLERLTTERPARGESVTRALDARWRHALELGAADGRRVFSVKVEDDLRMLCSYARRPQRDDRGDAGKEQAVVEIWAIGTHDHVFDRIRRMGSEQQWQEYDEARKRLASTGEGEVGSRPGRDRPARRIYPDTWQNDDLDFDEVQESARAAPGPIVLEGSAGSGKTNVLVRRAVDLAQRGRSVLFVTFQKELAQWTNRLVSDLRARASQGSVDVWTFRELCEHLWPNDATPLDWNRIDQEWARRVERLKSSVSASTSDIEAELRALLFGRWVKENEPPTREDFVGAKRSERESGLLFLDEEQRAKLFDAFEKRVHLLNSGGELDEFDVVRDLAARVEDRRDGRWTDLVLDEAQDFTYVELVMLGRLVDPRCWSVAGDPLQSIRPTLFAWPRLRDAVYAVSRDNELAGRFQPVELHSNHRNPPSIGRLSRRILDPPEPDRPPPPVECAVADHLPPSILDSTDAAAVMKAIAQAGERVARTAVLVWTDEVRRDLQGRLKSTQSETSARDTEFQRVFTVEQVKGLEFDVVFLIAPDAAHRGANPPRAQQEYDRHRWYVAVTRTRAALYVISRDEQGVVPEWAKELRRVEPQEVKGELERIDESQPEDWLDLARDLEEQSQWPAVHECLSRAHDWAAAAKLAEQIARAAREPGSESASWYDKAATEYQSAGDGRSSGRCRAEARELRRDWYGAAEAWREVDALARARWCTAQGHHGAARDLVATAAAYIECAELDAERRALDPARSALRRARQQFERDDRRLRESRHARTWVRGKLAEWARAESSARPKSAAVRQWLQSSAISIDLACEYERMEMLLLALEAGSDIDAVELDGLDVFRSHPIANVAEAVHSGNGDRLRAACRELQVVELGSLADLLLDRHGAWFETPVMARDLDELPESEPAARDVVVSAPAGSKAVRAVPRSVSGAQSHAGGPPRQAGGARPEVVTVPGGLGRDKATVASAEGVLVEKARRTDDDVVWCSVATELRALGARRRDVLRGHLGRVGDPSPVQRGVHDVLCGRLEQGLRRLHAAGCPPPVLPECGKLRRLAESAPEETDAYGRRWLDLHRDSRGR